MKKLPALTFSLLISTAALHAQSVYELSCNFPATGNTIAYKACYVDAGDGKAKLRLKFVVQPGTDTLLAELDAVEEFPDIKTGCINNDRVYYKLQNPRFIESINPGLQLPAYLCFQKDTATGFLQPFGITNTSADCRAEPVRFSQITFIEQRSLTKDFVLTYFKPTDLFYRNLFVTNNTRALTTMERNVKMYLLVVANVDDPKIGPAMRKNMNDAVSFFGKIKDFLGISQFIYDTITSARINKKNVENALQTFYAPAGPNDIVVFYFSGHGFRKPKDGRPGPYIDLKDKQNWKIMEASMSMEDIFETVRKKRVRLSLVLSDCCNADIDATNPLAEPPATKKSFGVNWSAENCRNLFLNTSPIAILGTASSPGQLAASNNAFGGFFTYYFKTSLETHFSYAKKDVSWEQVFKQATEQTKKKADNTWCIIPPAKVCDQMPYYRIEGRF